MTPVLPPSLSGTPGLGVLPALKRDVLGTIERAHRECGDVVRLEAGPPGRRSTIYTVFHPDGVRRVLATEADAYRKDSRFYNEIRWSLGDGLLNSQDERWKRQRRFIQPLFTRKRIDTYAEGMGAEAETLAGRWRPAVDAGEPIDLHAEMSRVTLRIVGGLLFGADVERAVPVVAHAFPVLGQYARLRSYSPAPLPRSWPLPANRRAMRARDAVYGICDEMIAARRAAGATGGDLMSLLIAARDGGEALDDEEIRDQVLIFLLAGHDTTAIALTFALHLLGHHPEAQARVRSEVEEVAGDRTPGAADVPQLAYTTMVLKEAMRLYPPAWATGRRVAAGDEVGGYAIPTGVRRHGEPVGDPSPPGVLGGAGALRPGALHAGGGGRSAPPRLLPVRRRAARLHRPVLLDAGGRDPARGDRPRPRAGEPRRPRAARAADHAASRRAGAQPRHGDR